MPLKLIPPRQGKSKNWTIRGTYLRVRVDRSSGTDRRALAAKLLADLEGRIERGEFPEKPEEPRGPTFLTAAVNYIKMRRPTKARKRYIGRLIQRFGETALTDIDQEAIDRAALEMYPGVSPASLNAYVYFLMSAILRLAGMRRPLTRPKGALGRVVTDYLPTEDAFAIIRQADAIDAEFGLLLKFLLYTGVRLGEALRLRPHDLDLERRAAWIYRTKNGNPRTLLLRGDLVEALAAHTPADPARIFRFRQGGQLYHYLARSKLAALGMKCPKRRPIGWRAPPNRFSFVNFHTFRHTWATWMRQYGGADVQGLVGTGNWSSTRAALRYSHVVAREEWQRVESLPADTRKQA